VLLWLWANLENNMNVEYIREQFVKCLHDEDFVIDKSGVKTIELINAVFHANEDSIFGNVNKEYVERELQWYKSMSLSVNDIPGGTPQIWKQVASKDGMINSNYGWCIYSEDNGYQFKNVLEELVSNPFSRRANMIYTRPSMHTDFNKDGMSDFICTNNVQYFIREGQLHACVFMRSNDAVFGYKNDYAWQRHVQEQLLIGINNRLATAYGLGTMLWNVGSLHVYERHFDIVAVKESAWV
jgi:thymidylate synthase